MSPKDGTQVVSLKSTEASCQPMALLFGLQFQKIQSFIVWMGDASTIVVATFGYSNILRKRLEH